jgi:hypothetical protein
MNNSNLDLNPNKKKVWGHKVSLSTNKALVKSFVEEVFNNHDISATEKYLLRRILR